AATAPKTADKLLASKPEKAAESTRAGVTTELRSAPESEPSGPFDQITARPWASHDLDDAEALGRLATRPLALHFRDRHDDLITGTVNIARSKPKSAGVASERSGNSGQSFDLSAADIQMSMPVLSTVPPLLPALSSEWQLPPLAWAALVTVGLEA